MSEFEQFSVVKEILNLVLQVLGIMAVVVSLYYTNKQLELTRETNQQNLEWNKKIATENELASEPDKAAMNLLNITFNSEDSHDKINLRKIENAIKRNKEVGLAIRHLLNKYERLARGIEYKIYVEEIVKDARRATFIRIFYNYHEYIVNRRKTLNKNAWIFYERLVEKWKSEMENEQS